VTVNTPEERYISPYEVLKQKISGIKDLSGVEASIVKSTDYSNASTSIP